MGIQDVYNEVYEELGKVIREAAARKVKKERKPRPKKPKKFWYTVCVHDVTKEELLRVVGPKCAEYEPGCACCEAHLQWQREGTMDVLVERSYLVGKEM